MQPREREKQCALAARGVGGGGAGEQPAALAFEDVRLPLAAQILEPLPAHREVRHLLDAMGLHVCRRLQELQEPPEPRQVGEPRRLRQLMRGQRTEKQHERQPVQPSLELRSGLVLEIGEIGEIGRLDAAIHRRGRRRCGRGQQRAAAPYCQARARGGDLSTYDLAATPCCQAEAEWRRADRAYRRLDGSCEASQIRPRWGAGTRAGAAGLPLDDRLPVDERRRGATSRLPRACGLPHLPPHLSLAVNRPKAAHRLPVLRGRRGHHDPEQMEQLEAHHHHGEIGHIEPRAQRQDPTPIWSTLELRCLGLSTATATATAPATASPTTDTATAILVKDETLRKREELFEVVSPHRWLACRARAAVARGGGRGGGAVRGQLRHECSDHPF